jgi:hypothetical protein
MDQEVRYTGTAPGQAGSVSIAGHTFRRGEVYELDPELAEYLIRSKGGFEYVEKKKKPQTEEVS